MFSRDTATTQPAVLPVPSATHMTATQAFATMKSWIYVNLPRLNMAVYAGQLSYQAMAATLNRALFLAAPAPETLLEQEAKQALMILGMCGSSIERHAQQSALRAGQASAEHPRDAYNSPPAASGCRGLDLLVVDGRPFTEYFQRVADRIGHPYRDSFASYVEYNGPAVQVLHPEIRAVCHSLPAVFEDDAWLSFTGQAAEIEFLALLKTCAALQGAANHFLEQIQATSIGDPAASAAALNAATLMLAIRAQMVRFMKHSQFTADFFLDILRQYACSWSSDPSLRPPSGAHDASALHRDAMLFAELLPACGPFPGYTAHLRRVFGALVPQDIRRLESALHAESIDTLVFHTLGMPSDALAQLDDSAAEQLVQRNPWLAAYTQLYAAQRDVSHAHYGMVMTYLVEPKRTRDAHNDPREAVTVVSNAHGSSGLDPLSTLRQLDDARATHPLARLSQLPRTRRQLDALLQGGGYRRPAQAELGPLARFAIGYTNPHSSV